MSFIVPVGDFNRDGRADLVAIRRDSGAMWLYAGTPQGKVTNIRQVGHYWTGFKAVFSPGDLNKDGRRDLIAVDRTGTMRRYINQGGRWSAHREIARGFRKDRLFA